MVNSPAVPVAPGPGRGMTPVVAVLLAGSAAIHLAMVPAHASSSVLEGVLFGVAGWVQAGLAAALLLRPTRKMVTAAIAVSLGILGAWVASRTLGLPFGPHAGTPEPVGLVDGLCSAFEILVVVVGVVAL